MSEVFHKYSQAGFPSTYWDKKAEREANGDESKPVRRADPKPKRSGCCGGKCHG
jgi:hypothetical protein